MVLDSYDFIIVGAGSAGAIVAAKLSENEKINVLLIEAGGSGSHITDIPRLSEIIQIETNMSRLIYTTVQETGVCSGKPCILRTGRVLGGSSTHNDMYYVRGSEQDFIDWTAFGSKGWSYEEVLPYMIELETFEDRGPGTVARGKHGPVHVTHQADYPFDGIRKRWKAAAIASGYEVGDYNGPRQTYFNDFQKNVRNGVRQSTDNVYLKPVMGKRSNLHVITFSHVTRILFNGNQAIGVEFKRNGTLTKVMASREVILSAGALASPQILMLSGIGPAKQLRKFNIPVIVDLAGVGSNFQDHLQVTALISTSLKYLANSEYDKKNYELWKSKKQGILASTQACSAAFLPSKYSVDSNDTQLYFGILEYPDEAYSPSRVIIRVDMDSYKTLSRGYVRLRSADPFQYPIVDPRYLTRLEDKENLIDAMKTFFALMKTKPFREIRTKLIVDSNSKPCSEQFAIYSDAWLYCFAQKNGVTDYHFTGSCKMGPSSDPSTVVDDRLRVHKVTNLRVVDASIMPQVTRGNTNAPSMLIGLKGAYMIRQDCDV